MSYPGALAVTALVLVLAACNGPRSSEDENRLVLGDTTDTTTITGTVRHLDLEGGFWAVEGDTTTYEPMNLPESFQEEGLRVRLQADVQEDAVSFRMIGPIIEIRAIERLANQR